MAATGGTKTIVTALVANFTIAVAKFFGFIITSSSAMLAEAVHSVADTSNQALLLLGKKRSEKYTTLTNTPITIINESRNQDSKVIMRGIRYTEPALKMPKNAYLSIEENFII